MFQLSLKYAQKVLLKILLRQPNHGRMSSRLTTCSTLIAGEASQKGHLKRFRGSEILKFLVHSKHDGLPSKNTTTNPT